MNDLVDASGIEDRCGVERPAKCPEVCVSVCLGHDPGDMSTDRRKIPLADDDQQAVGHDPRRWNWSRRDQDHGLELSVIGELLNERASHRVTHKNRVAAQVQERPIESLD